ncbi:PilX N-terminal domain-containing pilus assembly protein [Pseudomonas sp. NPDC086251]|jgi:type IV pilus assembly protein PilX|uniref:pilus assembly PilX family protein n=1 Tax=Pseudomonas sp. NPDC086251 TaxID=3364431 RepID=UPI0038396286
MSFSTMSSHRQRGMALLVSLVFLLLLTLIGISSMQNATLQEKMAGSVTLRNQAFQSAEAALRIGESAVQVDTYTLPVCSGTSQCLPPAESSSITTAVFNSTSGVTWIAAGNGFYGVQNIGTTLTAVNVPSNTSATLYRVTAVGFPGTSRNSRSVVESIYAKY